MTKKVTVIAAVLWMVGTLLSFSVLAVSIRELSNVGFTIFEILTVRASGMLIIVGTLLIFRPELRAHTRPQRMITTKEVTNTSSTFSIVFWMGVIQFPGGRRQRSRRVPKPRDALPLLGLAIAGTSAHYCLSNAFRAGDATLVVPLDFMRIPLIAVVGWAPHGESLHVFVPLGAMIIVMGVPWNLRAKSRQLRQAVSA